MATRITVDEEFGAGSWWADAQARSDIPPSLKPILNAYEQEIEVSEEEAESLLAWCQQIPGWNDGTEYATHPLLFNPAD